MTTQRKKISVNGLVRALLFISFSLFFLYQAQQAETNQEGLVGPALVPSVVCALLCTLGIITGIRALFFSSPIQTVVHGQNLTVQTFLKLAVITLLGFAYIWAFTAFGYLLATLLAFLTILFIFGNRNIVLLSLYGVFGTLTYYVVFVKLMKMYDPPGELINVQSFLPF